MMEAPQPLKEAVEAGKFAFIYGPPATGKTRLAYHIALSAGGSVAITTELGAVTYARAYGLQRVVLEARTMDELASRVLKCYLAGRYVVIDTINHHYRADPSRPSRKQLALVSSIMRLSGGIAMGQASMGDRGLTAPGMPIISRYADIIAVTRRRGPGLFELEFLRPPGHRASFSVRGGGLEWL